MELNKLHTGISYETYAAAPGLRASALKDLKRSPAHLKASIDHPKESTEALEFGKVFHAIVENGERFLDTYKVEPEFVGKTLDGRESTRSAEAKAKKAAWYAELPPDAVVVKKAWVEDLVGMCRSLKAHKTVGSLIKNGVRESSLWTEDPETGVVVKCRPDFISDTGFLCDFKSTRNAHPDEFLGDIFDARGYFYSMQLAHYCNALRAAKYSTGESATIIAVEKTPPYGVMVYPLDVSNLAPGEQWRAHLTRLYAKCVKEDRWPGYDERVQQVLTPEWVKLPPQEWA